MLLIERRQSRRLRENRKPKIMATAPRIAAVQDVTSNQAVLNRLRTSQPRDDVKFFNVSESILAATPGHLGRYKDIFNAIDDFLTAYTSALKAGQLIPADWSTSFTKSSKGGWLVIAYPPGQERQRSSSRPVVGDVA